MIEIFMPRKLKFQVLLFMTFNVILWFVISDSAMGILDVLEARNIYSMTKKSYSLFILFQALLYVLVNIPFVFFLINHIDKPVQKILKVLNRIKEEDFSEQIEFCATNEFDEIKNSINVMSQELEKSIRLREEIENQRIMLFANMAHDLKTPITSIQGYSQALADGIVTSEEKAGEYIKTIYAKSQSMNDLIERMFEYVKLDSRENILHFEKTNLAELLRNCIASSYSEFEEKTKASVSQKTDVVPCDSKHSIPCSKGLKSQPLTILGTSLRLPQKTTLSKTSPPISQPPSANRVISEINIFLITVKSLANTSAINCDPPCFS